MTSVRELKKDVEMLEKVLTPKEPDKKGNEINQLLRQYENTFAMATKGMSPKERMDFEHELIMDVIEDLREEGVF